MNNKVKSIIILIVLIITLGALGIILKAFQQHPIISGIVVFLVILAFLLYKPYTNYKKIKAGDLRYDPRFEERQRTILIIARKNHGLLTPSEIAIESNLTIEVAKKYLEYFNHQGLARVRIADNGAYVYEFTDLLSERDKQTAESF